MIGQPAYVRDQVLIYSSRNEMGIQGKRHAVFTYEIDKSMLDLWSKYEVDKIAEWYASVETDSKSIKAKLKRSIIWCSYAINADTKEMQFVSLTTALESLLLDKSESKDLNLNWGSISQRLAERVAYLLGKNYEDRTEFAKKTKKLYGLRSDIVHGGTILEEATPLFAMEDIVYASIIAFAKHNFISWEKFMDWENQQKYSIPD